MRALLAALLVGACAAPVAGAPPEPRDQISIDALVADAQGYVSRRYQRSELPAALIADLAAQEFQCQHSATVSECGSSRHAFASCWDVVTVRIEAERVSAQQNRRCMGANP